MNAIYDFETKCRRCGKIHSWQWKPLYGQYMTIAEINQTQEEKTVNPLHYPCDDCNKETIQDLVYFSREARTNDWKCGEGDNTCNCTTEAECGYLKVT